MTTAVIVVPDHCEHLAVEIVAQPDIEAAWPISGSGPIFDDDEIVGVAHRLMRLHDLHGDVAQVDRVSISVSARSSCRDQHARNYNLARACRRDRALQIISRETPRLL
jgi:hypothetical protein